MKQTEFIILAKTFNNSSDIVKEIKKSIPEIILLKHNNPIEKELLNSFFNFFRLNLIKNK